MYLYIKLNKSRLRIKLSQLIMIKSIKEDYKLYIKNI